MVTCVTPCTAFRSAIKRPWSGAPETSSCSSATASRRAPPAEHRLVALGGDAGIAGHAELLAQVGLGQGLLGQARERFREQVLQHLRWRERQDRLAQRAGVKRQLDADLEHAEGGVGSE